MITVDKYYKRVIVFIAVVTLTLAATAYFCFDSNFAAGFSIMLGCVFAQAARVDWKDKRKKYDSK